mmetsp:Transcript_1872/g.4437  ORF Transcript_1872/g.4437 Transcript_1872/m.4437 type:complete len:105 (+) Transcript_1872:95-409(+)
MELFKWNAKISEQESESISRRCGSLERALHNCFAANGTDSRACVPLEINLIDCKSKVCCERESAEHSRCYHSLVETGEYLGRKDCNPAVEAMRKCLRRKGVEVP